MTATMESGTEAEPLSGTITHQVGFDLAACVHCDAEIIRLPPDWSWDHFDTGEPECVHDSPLDGDVGVTSSLA
jgi:hypothetical protein